MPIFLVGLPVLAVIYIANLIADRGGHGARLTFNLLLFLVNGPLVIAGLGFEIPACRIVGNVGTSRVNTGERVCGCFASLDGLVGHADLSEADPAGIGARGACV